MENVSRRKADPGDSSHVGAPMSGVVVEIRVHEGTDVKKGDPVAVLSAMKMVRIRHRLESLNLTIRVGNGYQCAAFRKSWRASGQRG